MEFNWTDGPVKVAVRAKLCGPLAIHDHLTRPYEFAVTHTGTGFALDQIFDKSGADMKSMVAVQQAAEDLMRRVPNLDDLLVETHAGPARERRQEIGRILLDALDMSVSGTGEQE